MDFNDIKDEDCCLHSSFPEVEKNIKDDKVIKKLIDIYAGSKGEFTASSLYVYQSFILKPKEKRLSEILERISICEMSHVEILSQILLSMGINPKFCKYIDNNQNICNYWSAGNVKYITDIATFIDYNIKSEEFAIKEYNELIALTDSQNIKDIVNEIIKDEKAHLSIFKKIKDMLNKENCSRSVTNEKENEIKDEKEIVSIFSSDKNINTNNKNSITQNTNSNEKKQT